MPWADDIDLEHFGMFTTLCMDYPAQMKALLDKCAKANIHDFAAKRFAKMQDIYDNVLNNKNREDAGSD